MPVKYLENIKVINDLPLGVTLFTSHSPNAHKITILLELLNVHYHIRVIDRVGLEQKQNWFKELNPQGKVPLIVDRLSVTEHLTVSESNAILLYVANKFDKEFKFFKPERINTQLYYNQLKYLFLQEGGLRPVQFQWKWYLENDPQNIEAINHFKKETLIVHDVIELQLDQNGTGYLTDKSLNISDIAFYPFLDRSKNLLKVDFEKYYPLTNELFNNLSKIAQLQDGLKVI